MIPAQGLRCGIVSLCCFGELLRGGVWPLPCGMMPCEVLSGPPMRAAAHPAVTLGRESVWLPLLRETAASVGGPERRRYQHGTYTVQSYSLACLEASLYMLVFLLPPSCVCPCMRATVWCRGQRQLEGVGGRCLPAAAHQSACIFCIF